MSDITGIVDGTGFSNMNPSFYYLKTINGKPGKNFTKTSLLADSNTKLVLNIVTHADKTNEFIDFVPLVKQLQKSLRCIIADKGYDK